jgi:hypothetical protein
MASAGDAESDGGSCRSQGLTVAHGQAEEKERNRDVSWRRKAVVGVGKEYDTREKGIGALSERGATKRGMRWERQLGEETDPLLLVRNRMLVSLRGGGGELGNLKP